MGLVGDSEKLYRLDLAKIRLGQLPFLGSGGRARLEACGGLGAGSRG